MIRTITVEEDVLKQPGTYKETGSNALLTSHLIGNYYVCHIMNVVNEYYVRHIHQNRDTIFMTTIFLQKIPL